MTKKFNFLANICLFDCCLDLNHTIAATQVGKINTDVSASISTINMFFKCTPWPMRLSTKIVNSFICSAFCVKLHLGAFGLSYHDEQKLDENMHQRNLEIKGGQMSS